MAHQETSTNTDQPLNGLAVANGSALVRQCDICGNINAIDLDYTEKHERELQLPDHTTYRVDEETALRLWKTAKRCDHKKLIADLKAQLSSQNAEVSHPAGRKPESEGMK